MTGYTGLLTGSYITSQHDVILATTAYAAKAVPMTVHYVVFEKLVRVALRRFCCAANMPQLPGT